MQRAAQLNLDYTDIRAPFAGRLGRNQAAIGTLAGAGQTVLNTLVQIDPVYVTFDPGETDLVDLGERAWRRVRGARVGLVLQDALVSLDPLRPIGREIDDALRLHTRLTPRQRRERALELYRDLVVEGDTAKAFESVSVMLRKEAPSASG